MNKTLVMIIGPPAVGKTTVGAELSGITGFPLFHAHLSIEAVLPVFDFGTAPFRRLVTNFRKEMLSEVVISDLPGLIYTYVWAFGHAGELEYVQDLASIFEASGGRVVFAELKADLAVRLERNEGEDRLAAKASKRDVESSRKRLLEHEEDYRFNSDGDFPFPDHLLIDNTRVDPRTVAQRIADHFSLPRMESFS
ncbi:MAG: AAA family ATPase [Gemmatimonadetes bacterium]|nr:AAA family ATPase [Gemmatimonadota bacterium]